MMLRVNYAVLNCTPIRNLSVYQMRKNKNE